MRSFLAGLALFLAFVTGTIALSAYVAETVLLDPSRAGEVVGKALSRSDVREEILTRAVPGYDRLDPRVKAAVDEAARSSAARKALDGVQLSDDGTIRLDSLRDGLASELRANGQAAYADRLEAADTGEVTLPARYTNRLESARTTARSTWQKAGLAAGVLAVIALLVSKRRIRTLGSIGLHGAADLRRGGTARLAGAQLRAGLEQRPARRRRRLRAEVRVDERARRDAAGRGRGWGAGHPGTLRRPLPALGSRDGRAPGSSSRPRARRPGRGSCGRR